MTTTKNAFGPPVPNTIPMWKILFILFLEGFVSVSFQMIVMRQLTPYIGSSSEPVSLVIGMFLASLSIGYWLGGIFNKSKYDTLKIMCGAFVISSAFIGVFFSTFILNVTLSSLGINSFIQSLPIIVVYLSVGMCIPVTLIAMTVPLLSSHIKANNQNEATGKTMALSTVGSVAGSIFTSLVLFFVFGVSSTIYLVVISLVVLALICSHRNVYVFMGTTIILLLTGWLNLTLSNTISIKETSYNTYNVYLDKNAFEQRKAFIVNNQFASGLFGEGEGERSTPYIERVRQILFSNLNYKNSEVLVLGAGGFTLSHNDTSGNKFTYVDIDPAIKGVAENYFLNTNINGDFYAQDARSFLKFNHKKYDVIFVDLYSHYVSMPWQVSTVEFMNLLKQNIKPDGVVSFNIISKFRFQNKHTKRMHNTISTVFPFCLVDAELIEPNTKRDINNVIYACFPSKSDNDLKPYVDDKSFNPSY